MSAAEAVNGASVDVNDLRVELVGSGIDVVDEVVIEIRPGEVLGLVGESGCGKTTVGMALLGHVRRGGRVTAGAIRISGRDLNSLREGELRHLRGGTVSYIPQDPGTALNPALRIGRQLFEILEAHAIGSSAQERERRVREGLEEVALPSDEAFMRRYPHQLSGGQQQRVAIAMAFANRPAVIVCDEPTTGLDVTTQARVLETVRDLCRTHRVAALYVSHDLAVVAELADRVAVMYAGRIVENGPREQLFAAPLHPYTRRLLRAVPDIAGKRTVVGIPGHAALPGNRPEGCFYHPRCDFAQDDCRKAFPPVTQHAPGHYVRCYHVDDLLRAAAPEGKGQLGRQPAEKDVVLAVHHLNARYGSRDTLFDIDLDVHRNECLAVVGESGSGKTTLARCIAGLHKDWTGELRVGDTALATAARERSNQTRKDIQYIFQNPYASLNPRRTIGQTIARQLDLLVPGRRSATGRRVAECLERVALSADAANRFPDQLSGGERQRVAIARALAAEPKLLVCDEVTSALDVSVQAAIIELLGRLRNEMGLSLLFITHDLALIRTIADIVAVMTEGRLVEQGSVEQIFNAPSADYTQKLLADTPSIEVVLRHATAPRPEGTVPER
jgi:peptide/nickel transport system ATP-binding protein